VSASTEKRSGSRGIYCGRSGTLRYPASIRMDEVGAKLAPVREASPANRSPYSYRDGIYVFSWDRGRSTASAMLITA